MCFTQIKLVTHLCCPDLTKCLSSFDVMDLFRALSYHHQACVSTYIQPTPYRTSQFDILIKANKIWIYTKNDIVGIKQVHASNSFLICDQSNPVERKENHASHEISARSYEYEKPDQYR